MLHAFVAVTQILPPDTPDVAVMLAVPCPESIIHPAGSVHVYVDAPLTGTTE